MSPCRHRCVDLRLRIVRAVERGSSIRAAAQRFALSPSAAIKLMQRVSATGSAAPARYGGHRRPLLAPHEATCASWSWRPPTSRWPSSRPSCSGAVGCGPGSRRSPTRSAGSACGIKKSLRAAEQDRPDVAGKRRRWRAWQRSMNPARFVFLDETGTAPDMTRRCGRSPLGERLVAAVPHGHWHTTTLIAGLRQTGVAAPLVLDGPITGVAFRAYVEQFLAPDLAPGDVVVLDNLAAHKVDGVRQALAAAGASLLYCRRTRPT
jgi:DDE superfamily endonuclease